MRVAVGWNACAIENRPTLPVAVVAPLPCSELAKRTGTPVSTGPFGLAELDALDPGVARAAHTLFDLVMSFRRTQVQTVAILPEIR